MIRSTLVLLLAVAVLTAPAAALEISLEENRAERGNIGFVDIRRVFRLFPETAKARQSYAEIVRQAEDQVNLRRGELLTLRTELAGLRAEREQAAKGALPEIPPEPVRPEPPTVDIQPLASGPATQVPSVVAGSSAPVSLEEGATKQQAAGPELRGLPGMASPPPEERDVSSARSEDMPLAINIPGINDEPILLQVSISTASGKGLPAQERHREEMLAFELAVRERELALLAREEAVKGNARQLLGLDAKIAAAEKALSAKESALDGHQASLEKNLVDIESRRSEILLGKIYRAIRDVARENGVSVVVDKAQILYGQPSVDMTEKVIRKLEGI